MAEPISAAAAAFTNWAYSTFFAAAGYGTTAHAVISASLYYGAQAAIYTGVQMGLNAVAQAQIPNPEAQKITKKQSRPPRQYCGGGPVRQSGPYMLRETIGSQMALVIALADQRLATVGDIYLNDDKVTLLSGWVQEGEDGRYGTGDLVHVDYRLGLPTETRHTIFPPEFNGVWPSNARGDGIASLAVFAQHRSRESFSTHFPNGEVIPSAVIQPVCYDWRDETQDREDETTWKATANPIVWLVHLEWWLFGRSWTRAIAPVLDALTVEADYCDAPVDKIGGTEPRYRWAGGWASNTEPDAIRSNILATCDGWLTTDGRGRLVIKAGRYEEPTFVITAEHIEAYSWRRGQTDEEACNELIVSYVSPEHDYTEVECDPWRDEADISTRGKVRSENLGLTWVSHHTQARRLAKRKMSRVNTPRRGTVRTGIYGLNGLGHRYIRVQNPELSSMTDVVCEVMNVEVDFNAASVTFDIIQADPDIDEWDPATEEGAAPPIGEAAPVVSVVEQPTEFAAVVEGATVNLSWRNPFDGVFDFVNVYRAAGSTDFEDAAIVDFHGGAPGALVEITDEPGSGSFSYWLVSVDSFGKESQPVGPETVSIATYADFVAHITALAVDGEIPWRSDVIGSRVGTFRTTASGSSADIMSGSSWLSQFRGNNTYVQSAVRHGLPSQAEYDAQRTAGRQILVVIQSTTYAATPGLARNGYTSLANSTSTAPCIMPSLLAWVGPDVGGYAIEMQPSLGLGPAPYTW